MPSILLVRHGQASFGAGDYDRLSPLGERQAEIVGAALAERELNISAIVSGGLRRQVDTAAPLATRLGLTPTVDARWDEYAMDEIIGAYGTLPAATSPAAPAPAGLAGAGAVAGAAAGSGTPAQRTVTSDEFQSILDGALVRWMAASYRSSTAESWPAFKDRVDAALTAVAADLPSGSTAVVFTSGGVIATALGGLLGFSPPQLLSFNRVTVNAGITRILSGRRGLSFLAFNEQAHLETTEAGLISYR